MIFIDICTSSALAQLLPHECRDPGEQISKTIDRGKAKMKNWTIKRKLTILAGVSVLMLFAVAGAGLQGITRVSNSLNEVSLRNDALQDLMIIQLAQLNTVMGVREGVAWNSGQNYSEIEKRQMVHDANKYYTGLASRQAKTMKGADEALVRYYRASKSEKEAAQWERVQKQWQGFQSSNEAASEIIGSLSKVQDWSSLENLAAALEGQESLSQPFVTAVEQELNMLLAITREASTNAALAGREAQQSSQASMVGIFTFAMATLALLCLIIVRGVVGSLEQLRSAIVNVAESSDFRIRIQLSGKDEVVETANAFDNLLVRCRALLLEVAATASQLSEVALEAHSASERVSAGAVGHQEAAASIGDAIKEVTDGLSGISMSARQALVRATGSGDVASEGAQIISSTSAEMDNIVHLVDGAGEAIKRVDDQFMRISLIMKVIKEVADQTNLLALNAAIEAARAGEMGRGFAVVADEVRKLAERTTRSTEEISHMIASVKASSTDAVERMEKVVEKVRGGKSLSNAASEKIVTIRNFAQEVKEEVEAISYALEHQNSFAESIASQLESVEATTAENTLTALQTARVSAELQQLASRMEVSLKRFKI